MISVFISYRHRDTTPGWAAFIHEQLNRDGEIRAFKDVEGLEPGVDWRRRIREELENCDVCFVLIGPLWGSLENEGGCRCLDDPNDFHVYEIKVVLQERRVRVVPVLFDPAPMPRTEELPNDIKSLVDRQWIRWHSDLPSTYHAQRLEAAARLGPLAGEPAPESQAAEPEAFPEPDTATTPPPDPPGPDSPGPFSAHVLALLAELREEVPDDQARLRVEELQAQLRSRTDDHSHLGGDAMHADAVLRSLELLSWKNPELSFVRDRVEALRDGGPDMQLIELAHWYERSTRGEIELPEELIDELSRLLSARTPAERLEVEADARPAELHKKAVKLALKWRARQNSAALSITEQRVAGDLVRFYEQLSSIGPKLPAQAVGA